MPGWADQAGWTRQEDAPELETAGVLGFLINCLSFQFPCLSRRDPGTRSPRLRSTSPTPTQSASRGASRYYLAAAGRIRCAIEAVRYGQLYMYRHSRSARPANSESAVPRRADLSRRARTLSGTTRDLRELPAQQRPVFLTVHTSRVLHRACGASHPRDPRPASRGTSVTHRVTRHLRVSVCNIPHTSADCAYQMVSLVPRGQGKGG